MLLSSKLKLSASKHLMLPMLLVRNLKLPAASRNLMLLSKHNKQNSFANKLQPKNVLAKKYVLLLLLLQPRNSASLSWEILLLLSSPKMTACSMALRILQLISHLQRKGAQQEVIFSQLQRKGAQQEVNSPSLLPQLVTHSLLLSLQYHILIPLMYHLLLLHPRFK